MSRSMASGMSSGLMLHAERRNKDRSRRACVSGCNDRTQQNAMERDVDMHRQRSRFSVGEPGSSPEAERVAGTM